MTRRTAEAEEEVGLEDIKINKYIGRYITLTKRK